MHTTPPNTSHARIHPYSHTRINHIQQTYKHTNTSSTSLLYSPRCAARRVRVLCRRRRLSPSTALYTALHCMYNTFSTFNHKPQTTNHKNPSRFAKYDPSLGCGNQHPQSTTLTFHKYQKTAKSRSSRGHTQAPKPKSKPPQPTHGQASTPLHNRHLLTLLTLH